MRRVPLRIMTPCSVGVRERLSPFGGSNVRVREEDGIAKIKAPKLAQMM
jgi:hypothetical protein